MHKEEDYYDEKENVKSIGFNARMHFRFVWM